MGSVITRRTVKTNKDAPVEVTGSDIGNKRYQDTTAVIFGSDGVNIVPVGVNAAGEIINARSIPVIFDDIVLTYTGNNLTKVEYKLGGPIIATLDLTYTGARLDRVEVS